MERRAAIEAAVAHLPLMLTVEQARAVLGIGRLLAYGEVSRYFATGGREGVPAVRIGSVVRIPRTALVELLASVTVPTSADVAVLRAIADTAPPSPPSSRSRSGRRPPSKATSTTVAQLPFAASD
jgi:hypothetical protein